MSSSLQKPVHKKATVVLSGWKWQSTGAYAITFVAKDTAGVLLGRKTITVHVNVPATGGSSSTSSATGGGSSASSTSSAAPSINVWWPTDGAVLSGVQPFKVQLPNVAPADYRATWSVDGGQENTMADSQQDGPHKESLVDLTSWVWRGSGPYALTFRVYDSAGVLLDHRTLSISTGGTVGSSSTSSASSVTSVPSGGNPLSGISLFVQPDSPAKSQADAWRASRPADARQLDKIATHARSQWLGAWNANVGSDVSTTMSAAAAQGAVPTFVVYNIPQRDCGGYSAGGASSSDAYRAWIRSIASAIGSGRAIVILEPDAVALVSCLSAADRQTRMQLLQDAVSTFKAHAGVKLYLDAGHAGWVAPAEMATSLQQAGIAQADGFALNVSNFDTDTTSFQYGNQISSLLSGKHFVVDVSRNGLGPDGSQWCNPSGRALGRVPTVSTGTALVDAYLWIKAPGESDGTCNGGPSAGTFWAEYALGLAQRAAW